MYVEELPLLKKVYIAAQFFQKKENKKENNFNTFLIIMELMNLNNLLDALKLAVEILRCSKEEPRRREDQSVHSNGTTIGLFENRQFILHSLPIFLPLIAVHLLPLYLYYYAGPRD